MEVWHIRLNVLSLVVAAVGWASAILFALTVT
jgi:hypothetical protein